MPSSRQQLHSPNHKQYQRPQGSSLPSCRYAKGLKIHESDIKTLKDRADPYTAPDDRQQAACAGFTGCSQPQDSRPTPTSTRPRPGPCSPAVRPAENGTLLWSWSSRSPSQLYHQPNSGKRRVRARHPLTGPAQRPRMRAAPPALPSRRATREAPRRARAARYT